MDIYLIDQILKDRYEKTDVILDAGCGSGRNMPWFIEQGIDIHACDIDDESIEDLQSRFPQLQHRFISASIDALPYPSDSFDHIICSAVLHFSENEAVFLKRISELSRVLRKGGSLFIRMTTMQGLSELPVSLGGGRYALLDGSERFLLTPALLDEVLFKYKLSLLEAPKAVNVNDMRSMGVLVLKKD